MEISVKKQFGEKISKTSILSDFVRLNLLTEV